MIGYPYIASAGIELECGIPRSKRGAFIAWASGRFGRRFEAKTDPTSGGGGSNYAQGQEFILWSAKMADLAEFLDKAYGEYDVKASDQCGFHIHVKPNTRKISYDTVKVDIAHKAYQDEFINKYKLKYAGKPKYLNRLDTSYSRWNGISRQQLQENARLQLMHGGQRYTAINLLSTTEPQGTIEFRLMPNQGSRTEAKDSLLWLVKEANSLIKDMATNERELDEEQIRMESTQQDFTPAEKEDMASKGIKVRVM